MTFGYTFFDSLLRIPKGHSDICTTYQFYNFERKSKEEQALAIEKALALEIVPNVPSVTVNKSGEKPDKIKVSRH